jgi:hypothetical protein
MKPQDGPRPQKTPRPSAVNPVGLNSGRPGRPQGALKVSRVPTPFEQPFVNGLQLELPQAAVASLLGKFTPIPGAPPGGAFAPPLTPGQPNYDPQTGVWM